MRAAALLSLVVLASGCGTQGVPTEVADAGRGRLLYENACVACHTTQAHWRDKRLVQNWADLVGQVGRWQKAAGQNWGTDDIHDVAAYLNGRFYRVPCPKPGCSGTSG